MGIQASFCLPDSRMSPQTPTYHILLFTPHHICDPPPAHPVLDSSREQRLEFYYVHPPKRLTIHQTNHVALFFALTFMEQAAPPQQSKLVVGAGLLLCLSCANNTQVINGSDLRIIRQPDLCLSNTHRGLWQGPGQVPLSVPTQYPIGEKLFVLIRY